MYSYLLLALNTAQMCAAQHRKIEYILMGVGVGFLEVVRHALSR